MNNLPEAVNAAENILRKYRQYNSEPGALDYLRDFVTYEDAVKVLSEFVATRPESSERMTWVKAIDRLPELPNPLPPDTPDERGILFVNRAHSCGNFWYPSYGQPPQAVMNLQFEGWSIDQWEWLEENVKSDAFWLRPIPAIAPEELVQKMREAMLKSKYLFPTHYRKNEHGKQVMTDGVHMVDIVKAGPACASIAQQYSSSLQAENTRLREALHLIESKAEEISLPHNGNKNDLLLIEIDQMAKEALNQKP